jgi:hypothetical protein
MCISVIFPQPSRQYVQPIGAQGEKFMTTCRALQSFAGLCTALQSFAEGAAQIRCKGAALFYQASMNVLERTLQVSG